MSLFWRKGYHATSLKDLEAALAMKPGSIYAAFRSKEALFLDSLDRYFKRSLAGLDARMAQSETVLGGLAGHLRGFGAPEAPGAEQCDGARMCMIVKTLVETTEADGAVAARARECFDGMRAAFAEWFRRAREAGELPAEADPEQLARRYQTEISALRLEAHRGGDPAALAELADALARDVQAWGRPETGAARLH